MISAPHRSENATAQCYPVAGGEGELPRLLRIENVEHENWVKVVQSIIQTPGFGGILRLALRACSNDSFSLSINHAQLQYDAHAIKVQPVPLGEYPKDSSKHARP